MSELVQFIYVHSSGEAASCQGFKIPSADEGGLVVNKIIEALVPMVEEGILLCERSVVENEKVEDNGTAEDETKDSEPTGSEAKSDSKEIATEEPSGAEASENTQEPDSKEGSGKVIGAAGDVVLDDVVSTGEAVVTKVTTDDSPEIIAIDPKLIDRGEIEAMSFADLKVMASGYDVTGRSSESIISKLDELGVIVQ